MSALVWLWHNFSLKKFWLPVVRLPFYPSLKQYAKRIVYAVFYLQQIWYFKIFIKSEEQNWVKRRIKKCSRVEHWKKSCIVSMTVNSILSSTWAASQPLSEKISSSGPTGWCYSVAWLPPRRYRALLGETLKVLDAHTKPRSAPLTSRYILMEWG